nr:uncharacterized protein LOC109188424 [Ipomoea trifida]
MEGLQKTFRDAVSQDPKASLSSISSFFLFFFFFEKSKHNSSASASSSADHSQLLVTCPPRQMVSAWTCSKLCAFCFVAEIFFGYTLMKQRVRRWASKLLKQMKKD